ncbi:GNAT family N-acetyltransferase [Psychrobacter aestuarii]|uniref:GNAT family N-acetyltransferase n=1 Tax=Psychrobacter aestuarii TaxID=556327 RepID=A0ABN0VLM0_9GAMM|nr:GNAT family N-acetyltransferase [Psychrobacter aestuarii]
MVKTTPPATLTSERQYLRQWQASDFAPFAYLNADTEVMRYFPNVLSPDISDKIAKKCQALIAQNGWGLWAVCRKRDGQFMGFVGLNQTDAAMPFAPAVEMAWRLDKAYWGQGYATEAAQAALRFAFEQLLLDEVVAFTATINIPSQRVMQRLGMQNRQQNFYHPALADSHPLAEHVLYSITREQWQQSAANR